MEATIERLDPQVSQCGRVESTVWYRIDKAPDGTIVLGVTGTGLAPVVRVYELAKSSIEELVCSSAKAGAAARVGFETTRGASYLVLVGKRAGTADAAFTLNAGLFLPPANDTRSQARKMGKLPATVKGSTLGATVRRQRSGRVPPVLGHGLVLAVARQRRAPDRQASGAG